MVVCYLKYASLAKTCLDGFQQFLSKRCPQLLLHNHSNSGSNSNSPKQHIPPSLLQCFRNFDELVELGGCAYRKPLLLRAVAIQGVPVEDKPCIDVWDSFSSSPIFSSLKNEQDSQWADEDSFYRLHNPVVVEGDVLLLCRFGGDVALDNTDPSKVLFRYANNSGFLGSGPYEFPKSQVDMMRRYEDAFDDDEFLLTLFFESYWDTPSSSTSTSTSNLLQHESKRLPKLWRGQDALNVGWRLELTAITVFLVQNYWIPVPRRRWLPPTTTTTTRDGRERIRFGRFF